MTLCHRLSWPTSRPGEIKKTFIVVNYQVGTLFLLIYLKPIQHLDDFQPCVLSSKADFLSVIHVLDHNGFGLDTAIYNVQLKLKRICIKFSRFLAGHNNSNLPFPPSRMA